MSEWKDDPVFGPLARAQASQHQSRADRLREDAKLSRAMGEEARALVLELAADEAETMALMVRGLARRVD